MNPFSHKCPEPLFLFTLFIIILHASIAQDLITSTCNSLSQTNHNINYDFCTTSLHAADAAVHDLAELGRISIELIQKNVTDTSYYIKQLLKKDIWDDYTSMCLTDCLDLYSNAIDATKDAMASYNARCFDDANQEVSSVMTDTDTCEEGFKERRIMESPLTERNNCTFQLSAIALGIMKLIASIQLPLENAVQYA